MTETLPHETIEGVVVVNVGFLPGTVLFKSPDGREWLLATDGTKCSVGMVGTLTLTRPGSYSFEPGDARG